ncbi:unnamed protein product [Thelazia callipaeda]|uniref:RING-type domain-containing protein n=1 Tax=Thelazia callipaeda TaxID=103827 RepID=A0A0N5D554_THECL|nr:unnamed protein product [Thelazia callipaeda]
MADGNNTHHNLRQRNIRNSHFNFKLPNFGQLSECDICCRESDVFAVGKCLHPVCMECGIRLRVLCRNQICPKCRAVIDDLPLRFLKHKDAQEYRIHLADDYVVQCYNSYLSHPCVLCDKKHGKRIFDSFALLSQHMLAVHRFEYCGICVENLYLFTVERKFYSRSDLERHMKSGDPDNQSFKGHPQCWFCSTRFLDDEARYKHLRKDHFFCQLCDADGVDDVFFSNHSDLLDHHKSLHFVCEEDQCKVLGLAFRTETELKSHKSNCSISSQSSTTPALPADATRSSFSNFMQKFTLESCDFPRLEESTPSSSSPLQLTSSFAPRAQKSKVIKKSQKATTKQEIPANVNSCMIFFS